MGDVGKMVFLGQTDGGVTRGVGVLRNARSFEDFHNKYTHAVDTS